jgi:tetratricopeptide (TPR) repeat protein
LETARNAARVRQLRARLLAPAGELTRAQHDLEWVLAEAQRLNDRVLLGTARLDLGVVCHFRRELEVARSHYEAALGVLSEEDDAVAEARCHGNLGAVFHDQAQLPAAADGYRRAIALLPERGQERLLANFQSNLALVEHELGRNSQARSLYQRACTLLEALLDARLLGIVLGNFGTLELCENQVSAALALFEQAHAFLEHTGDRRSEALSLGRLSACLALSGRIAEAEQRSARAGRQLRKDPLARAVIELLSAFIDLAHAERDKLPTAARAALDRASAKCANAREQQHAGRRLYDQADDLRLYLNVLEPRIATARAMLGSSSPAR